MILPTKEELNAYDMSQVAQHFTPCPEIGYLFDAAGFNHYRLLRWVGEKYNKHIIFDIGTYMGLSAGSLAYSGYVIDTFDTNFSANKLKIGHLPVTFHKAVSEDAIPENLADASVVLVDTWHNSVMERKIYDQLVQKGWKGLLIYDDIYYNDAMKAFWSSIDHPGKIDATDIGHSTGTGIIEFI